MEVLSVEALPNQEFQIILDDQICQIHLYQKGDYMFLDLYIDDEAIVEGAIVQPKTGIIQSPSMFKGQLYIVDVINPADMPKQPNYTELGDRFELVYLTETECKDLGLRF